MPRRAPVDPPKGPKLALSGRVVTMDKELTVHPRGTVWIDKGPADLAGTEAAHSH